MHIELRPLVGLWFQVLFHSPPGVLFDFPSRYWFTFGQIRVFRLSPWSGWIPAEFPVLRSTWDPSRSLENLAYRTFTLFGVTSQTLPLFSPVPHWGPATPAIKMTGLAFSLFARRYWGNPLRFLFLRLLRCFSLPRSLTLPMYSVKYTLVQTKVGFPIRRSPDQSLFATPRSISLLTTSFIAWIYQVIHHKPLVAWPFYLLLFV